MPITPTAKIWMNGELVDWDAANIHVLTHSLHYGMGVFEGIRAYETKDGPAIFRLTEHIERLFRSAHILGMDIPFSVAELVAASKATVASTGLPSCYVRPIAYYGYGEMGLNTLPCKVDVAIACWPWPAACLGLASPIWRVPSAPRCAPSISPTTRPLPTGRRSSAASPNFAPR